MNSEDRPEYIPAVSRKEDMSPRGHLRIMRDNSGDIIVECLSDSGDGMIDGMASVEFCTGAGGGGKSPKTFKALLNLMQAMKEDNVDDESRRGEFE